MFEVNAGELAQSLKSTLLALGYTRVWLAFAVMILAQYVVRVIFTGVRLSANTKMRFLGIIGEPLGHFLLIGALLGVLVGVFLGETGYSFSLVLSRVVFLGLAALVGLLWHLFMVERIPGSFLGDPCLSYVIGGLLALAALFADPLSGLLGLADTAHKMVSTGAAGIIAALIIAKALGFIFQVALVRLQKMTSARGLHPEGAAAHLGLGLVVEAAVALISLPVILFLLFHFLALLPAPAKWM